MVNAFLAIVCTFEHTRIASARGKSQFVASRGANRIANPARAAAALNVIERRGPARSRIGAISGPASASGSIVSRR